MPLDCPKRNWPAAPAQQWNQMLCALFIVRTRSACLGSLADSEGLAMTIGGSQAGRLAHGAWHTSHQQQVSKTRKRTRM